MLAVPVNGCAHRILDQLEEDVIEMGGNVDEADVLRWGCIPRHAIDRLEVEIGSCHVMVLADVPGCQKGRFHNWRDLAILVDGADHHPAVGVHLFNVHLNKTRLVKVHETDKINVVVCRVRKTFTSNP